jgi:hypothetical protein
MLESKRLADGGFPLEEPDALTSARVVCRGSYATWGPAGKRRSNPLVSLAALKVIQAADVAQAVGARVRRGSRSTRDPAGAGVVGARQRSRLPEACV